MDPQVTLFIERRSLQELEPEWNELLENSHVDTVFLTWEWISTWWEVYGGNYELCVLTVRDSHGRLLGIAPFKVAVRRYLGIFRLSALEFIGFGDDVTPEYLDVIVRKGYESEVTPLIMKYVLKNIHFDTCDLRPFVSNSPNISLIQQVFDRDKAFYEMMEHSLCPVLYLSGSWDDFFSHKSGNFRKKMKEYSRVSRRDLNIKLIRSGSMETLEDDMNKLIKLHHNRWNGSSKAFRTQKYIDFHKRISSLFLERDWLRLYFLANDNNPIAGIYCFKYRNKYFYYQSGRDLKYAKYRVGLVLLNKVVREAFEEGAELFDFLSGDEPYKFRWAQSVNKNIRILYWRNPRKYILWHCCHAVRGVITQTVDIVTRRFFSRN